MKNFFSLFVVSLFTFSAVAADDVTLLFENAAKTGVTYNVSNSSEFPQEFRIVNKNEWNMYRLFVSSSTEGPKLFDYQGVEIEFDYIDPFDVPQDLQFFFSVDGFKNGYYPFVSELMEDEPVVKINFHEQEDGEYKWSNLFKVSADPDDATLTDFNHDVSPDARFNRFGFRNAGDKGGLLDPDDPTTAYEGSIMDVKLKSVAMINNNGEKEYFNIIGGGTYGDFTQGYRLYGPSMDLTVTQPEGSVAWDVEESFKYANIHLASPLSAEAAEYLVFFIDGDYGTVLDAEGLEEGSELIIIDIEGIEETFELSSDEANVSLNIKAIVLSDEAGGEVSISTIVSDDEELPAFVNVYAISGQLIKMNVAREAALEGLAKGLYIVHNKKVAVY